jgi:hypothetical protein
MNANALARNYGQLTPEERFRLILAASARGDDTERDRLAGGAGRIALSMSDHAPFVLAFHDMAASTFMELVDDAGRYFDAWARIEAAKLFEYEDDQAEGDDPMSESAEADTTEEAQEAAAEAGPQLPTHERLLDLALGAGFVLRAKADGWKLFCERMTLPPLLLWQDFPGLDRLTRALTLAERAAFTAEGFLRWMNCIRPKGEPERTEIHLTPARLADATAEAFRALVQYWSG